MRRWKNISASTRFEPWTAAPEALKLDLGAFDLILTDFNLPDVTGMELLGNIRAKCSTPVIIVTGENVGQIAAEAIRKGAMDYVVKFGDYLFTIPLVVEKNLTVAKLYKENEKLRVELERALEEKRRKNAQLEESLKMVEELAATDALTGLNNRRHFNRVLDQMFAESDRMDSDLSCVMIDLDGYKTFERLVRSRDWRSGIIRGGEGDLGEHAADGRGGAVWGR